MQSLNINTGNTISQAIAGYSNLNRLLRAFSPESQIRIVQKFSNYCGLSISEGFILALPKEHLF